MAKKFWQFRNLAGTTAELLLYGDISDSTWWGDEITPKSFADELNALGAVSDIRVRINSGGGDVFAAQTIGNLLEQHSATVTALIDGLCASAATVVACHCNKVVAANDSTYMVHPVQMAPAGRYMDAKTIQTYLDALTAIRENIVTLYAKKTGREKDEVAAWMDATSWWTGPQAKENGFVDELTDEEGDAVVENRSGVLFVNHVNMNLPFDEAPKFVQDSLAAAPAANGSVNKSTGGKPGNKNEEDENTMDAIKIVDDLRAAFPDMVDQLERAAADRARSEERQRIQDIEDMTVTGSEKEAYDAKFVKPVSATDYTKAVVKMMREKGGKALDAMKRDAEDGGAGDPKNETRDTTKDGKDDEFINAIRAVGKDGKKK